MADDLNRNEDEIGRADDDDLIGSEDEFEEDEESGDEGDEEEDPEESR